MPNEGPYDKVISIEMLEAVGAEFLKTYFECVHKLLKPQGGIAVFQCITMPETRYEAYAKGEDFIRKYIFPGGHLPTVSQLVRSIDQGSKSSLVVDSVENIGPHYAKTLRIWKDNFMKNFDARIRPALIAEHQGMNNADAALFRRKWEVGASKVLDRIMLTCCTSITLRTAKLGSIPARLGTSSLLSPEKGPWNCWRIYPCEKARCIGLRSCSQLISSSPSWLHLWF